MYRYILYSKNKEKKKKIKTKLKYRIDNKPYTMTIINGKVYKDGGSYKMRVPKALVDANLLEEKEEYNTILLSPQLNEEQRKYLDRLVNQLGSHMIAQDKQPEDVQLFVQQDDEEENTGQTQVEPMPGITIRTQPFDHTAKTTSENNPQKHHISNPWLRAHSKNTLTS